MFCAANFNVFLTTTHHVIVLHIFCMVFVYFLNKLRGARGSRALTYIDFVSLRLFYLNFLLR